MIIDITSQDGKIHSMVMKSMGEVKSFTPILTELIMEGIIRDYKIFRESHERTT